MLPGSKKAILYELKHGTFWTVVDEVLHSIRFLDNFDWRAEFCYWCHTRGE